MKILKNSEVNLARKFFGEARLGALNSICPISKCGAILARGDVVLGKGFNSPPGNKPLEKCFRDSLSKDFNSDRTCCIHAEQRAIIDAVDKFCLENIEGSTLYFTRLNGNRNIIPVGKPYCTICSKLALDNKVSKWVLFHELGFYEYDAEEYNEISFGFREWGPTLPYPKNL